MDVDFRYTRETLVALAQHEGNAHAVARNYTATPINCVY